MRTSATLQIQKANIRLKSIEPSYQRQVTALEAAHDLVSELARAQPGQMKDAQRVCNQLQGLLQRDQSEKDQGGVSVLSYLQLVLSYVELLPKLDSTNLGPVLEQALGARWDGIPLAATLRACLRGLSLRSIGNID